MTKRQHKQPIVSEQGPITPLAIETHACSRCGALLPQPIGRLDDIVGQAPNTVRNIRAVLRRALNQALKWELVARNVAALVDTPRIEQQEIAPLDDQQARALLAAIRGQRLEALYRLALSLGLRRGEALGLRWEDIDFEAATLRIVQTLQPTRTKGKVLSSTKNKSSTRTLPIPAVLLESLRRLKERQDVEHQQPGWQEHGLVFVSLRGTPLEPDNITHRFKEVLRKAGLPQTVRFHDLRHSCATLLLAQGVPPRVVMEILGHDQIATTMNIYGHVLDANKRDATTKIEELFGDNAEDSQAQDEPEQND